MSNRTAKDLNWQQKSIHQIRQAIVESINVGGGTDPAVVLVSIGDQIAVLKDYNRCHHWFARICGPILARRECKALEILESMPQIPQLLAKPDSRSLVIQYLPGTHIPKKVQSDDWSEFFLQLESTIAQMHALGVAHCDLRSRTNTLVTAEKSPVLVDFVACFCRGGRWNIFANILFKWLCKIDDSAVVKLKGLVNPELLPKGYAGTGHVGGLGGLLVRSISQGIRKISRAVFSR